MGGLRQRWAGRLEPPACIRRTHPPIGGRDSLHFLDERGLAELASRTKAARGLPVRSSVAEQLDITSANGAHSNRLWVSHSRKYGRAAADALSEPCCGMRCPDEAQLKQDEGDQQDGDSGDISPALYQ